MAEDAPVWVPLVVWQGVPADLLTVQEFEDDASTISLPLTSVTSFIRRAPIDLSKDPSTWLPSLAVIAFTEGDDNEWAGRLTSTEANKLAIACCNDDREKRLYYYDVLVVPVDGDPYYAVIGEIEVKGVATVAA